MTHTIPGQIRKALADSCGRVRIDASAEFQQAIQDMCLGYERQELALHLYEHYGLRTPFETWYSHFRKCLSRDGRERFELCDVFFLMNYTRNYQPLYVMCDLLGFGRPPRAEKHTILEYKRKEQSRLAARLSNLAGEIRRLECDVVAQPPVISVSRFSSTEHSKSTSGIESQSSG